MSASFRPVTETWGAGTDEFIDHESLCVLLSDAARAAGSNMQETEYGDLTAFWIEDGAAFLDYISSDDFNIGSLSEDLDPTHDGDAASLIQNMKSLAPEWRKSIDSQDGSLRFYID